MDCGRQGGPRDAQADVHPSGQSGHRRAVDAEGCLLPQAQAHQQHLGQARPGKLSLIIYLEGCSAFVLRAFPTVLLEV